MKIDPDTQLGILYREYELALQENALKLQSILDLEDCLYSLRIVDDETGKPCWCVVGTLDGHEHGDECLKAQELTEHLWSNINKL